MKIEIEIPKEFEEHFKQDKFEDSLNRLYADVHLLAGNYERELAEMLIKAFRESKPAYDIDKVVYELEENASRYTKKYNTPYGNNGYRDTKAISIRKAIEIVKQGGVSDYVCEWKIEDEEANLYLTGCQQRQLIFEGTPKENGYRYCPYCGRKIKVVE